jgi:hypothetical protein
MPIGRSQITVYSQSGMAAFERADATEKRIMKVACIPLPVSHG